MATRRGVLAGLLSAALPLRGWAAAGSPVFLAAGQRGGAHELHGLAEDGRSLFALPLPGRGHAAAAHPTRALAVAFARRPGTFALVIDCVDGRVTRRLTPPEGRQFNGHGAFNADGTVLYTSEVVAETSAGRVGIWRLDDGARLGEWDSGGIGPHEMRRLPDGALVVANGGIQTDPTDRTKLNLDEMRPNLTLLGPDGVVRATAALSADLAQNSIRHLAVLPGGDIAFAMQWEGDSAIPVPQLGLWTPGRAPRPAAVDDGFVMRGYAGAVAQAGGTVAVTSPRGGAVMLFDAAGQVLATHRRADICGIAGHADGFVASDGAGAIWRVDAAGLSLLARHDGIAWDNHIVPVGA